MRATTKRGEKVLGGGESGGEEKGRGEERGRREKEGRKFLLAFQGTFLLVQGKGDILKIQNRGLHPLSLQHLNKQTINK